MRQLLPLAAMLAAGCVTSPRAEPEAPLAEVGVAFDRAGERGAYAVGLADPATGRAVTPDDPARIASVSKLVVAIAVLRLVEQGRLDLDRDISGYLGWRLRNPAFPDRPVTIRMLLSHTSSLRDHDDQYAVPLGETVQDALRPATSWDQRNAPGTGYFAYSNMNFPVIASAIERVTGERFDIWIRREILDPLRIDACFNWPTCSEAAVARAVVLMQDGVAVRDDLRGKRPECPVFVRDGEPCDLARWRLGENGALFSPQGGLRISARGLARIGRLLLTGGELDGVRLLSPQSVDLLLAPQWRFDGRNGARDGESVTICSYGLAVQQLGSGVRGCNDDVEGSGRRWEGHAGDAYGLRSGVWIDRARGVGIAYFATGLPAAPKRGPSGFTLAEEQAFWRTAALLRP